MMANIAEKSEGVAVFSGELGFLLNAVLTFFKISKDLTSFLLSLLVLVFFKILILIYENLFFYACCR